MAPNFIRRLIFHIFGLGKKSHPTKERIFLDEKLRWFKKSRDTLPVIMQKPNAKHLLFSLF
jgi:hypothetical protein